MCFEEVSGGEASADEGADRRDEEEEPGDVGEKARGEQHRAGHEDEQSVGDFLVGQAAFGGGLPEALDGPGTLRLCQGGSEDTGDDDDGEGGPEADLVTQRDENRQFRDGNEDEEGEEPQEHAGTVAGIGPESNERDYNW